MYFKRLCPLPKEPVRSFFLWGPRQVGKTCLLKNLYPDARYFDLNLSDTWASFSAAPQLLREQLLALSSRPALVLLDEVQRVPLLLNEIQSLIDQHQFVFGLCGSSARKLKHGGGNLLGGRALRYEMHGFVSAELGPDFDLHRAVNRGGMPNLYLSSTIEREFETYVGDYVRDEIAAEGLVRNLPIFSNFLTVAAISDGHTLNFSKIGSECGISPKTAQEYFHILQDTLLGFFLPAYSRRLKRRVRLSPKFYFSDTGIANFLARRGTIIPGSEMYGRAFESWVVHEVRSYREYSEKFFELSYYQELDAEIEIDLILNDFEVALEIKSSEKVGDTHLKSMRKLKAPAAKKRLIVSRETTARLTADGIEILPIHEFLSRLWGGAII